MRAALLLALLFVAGCAAPAHPTPRPIVTTDHATNAVLPKAPCATYGGHTVLLAAGAQLAAEYRDVTVFDALATLEVPRNTTALVLDIWWEQGAATALRSQVEGPGVSELSPAQAGATPDSPLRLRFDQPPAGAWTWRAVADPAAAGVVVHFREGIYDLPPEALAFACNRNSAL